MFYHNRKALKCGVLVHLALTKSSLDLLMKANKYVNDNSNVDFTYSATKCRVKARFKNRREEFFDSMEDLIAKINCLES